MPGGSLVSAANQAAFNVANALGAALGADVLAAGLGYTSTLWVGAALALVGTGIATLAVRSERRERAALVAEAAALLAAEDASRVDADVANWRRALQRITT